MAFSTKKEKYAFVRGVCAGSSGKRPFNKRVPRENASFSRARSRVKEKAKGEIVKYTSHTAEQYAELARKRSYLDPFAKTK